jgi:hypothetical protein
VLVVVLLSATILRPDAAAAADPIIITVAGGGAGGDGGPATSAALSYPQGVALDSSGDLYIASEIDCRVRKVSGGTITTVAGTGTCGYAGDGGPATSANLNGPSGVAVEGGDLFIADAGNCRVRKVSGGTITTVAGTGTCGYGGDGGPATSASLNGPSGVAVEGGDLYVAEFINCRVRKVSGGTISTVAGNGSCPYAGDGGAATSASLWPFGVALDSSGDLYIADALNCRVRKVSSGTITTVAGTGSCGYGGDGGPATSASLYWPSGVAVGSSGDLYIGDQGSCRVRKVSGGTITTIAGTGTCGYGGDGGPATSAGLASPYGVALDSSVNLYIADAGNHRVRKVIWSVPPSVGGIAEQTNVTALQPPPEAGSGSRTAQALAGAVAAAATAGIWVVWRHRRTV